MKATSTADRRRAARRALGRAALLIACLALAAASRLAAQNFDITTIATPACRLHTEDLVPLAERYREILAQWATGSAEAAGALDRLLQDRVDMRVGFHVTDETVGQLHTLKDRRIVVPGIDCLEKIEDQTLTSLLGADRDAIWQLHALYLEVYLARAAPIPPFRRWLASRSRDRVQWLADQHRKTFGGPDARAEAGLMLLALADEMQASPFYNSSEEARDLFQQVIPLRPDGVTARYWAAILAERLADSEDAAQRFEVLARRVPEDREVELRLALQRARLGKRRAAARGSESVARSDAAAWIRIVAYQEWARLDPEPVTILEEALEHFPGESQLAIQLVSHLGTDWQRIDHLAETLARAGTAGPGHSARWRYEVARRDELDADRRDLDRHLAAHRHALARALLVRRISLRLLGAPDPELLRKIEGAGAEQLLEWADRLVTARSLAEIFAGSDS